MLCSQSSKKLLLTSTWRTPKARHLNIDSRTAGWSKSCTSLWFVSPAQTARKIDGSSHSLLTTNKARPWGKPAVGIGCGTWIHVSLSYLINGSSTAKTQMLLQGTSHTSPHGDFLFEMTRSHSISLMFPLSFFHQFFKPLYLISNLFYFCKFGSIINSSNEDTVCIFGSVCSVNEKSLFFWLWPPLCYWCSAESHPIIIHIKIHVLWQPSCHVLIFIQREHQALCFVWLP